MIIENKLKMSNLEHTENGIFRCFECLELSTEVYTCWKCKYFYCISCKEKYMEWSNYALFVNEECSIDGFNLCLECFIT